jgi:membrane-associated PAP2 superfamily phosphatase
MGDGNVGTKLNILNSSGFEKHGKERTMAHPSRLNEFPKINRRLILDFLIPCLVLVIMTMLLVITEADIRIERLFYQPEGGFVHWKDNPWYFLYQYGELPGIVMGGAAVVVFLAGFYSAGAHRYRKLALYFILLLALGPGLIVNYIFKDYWGRPRPNQVDVFGGDKKYQQVWQTGIAGEGKSFPSGHAAIAFYLFSPFLALRRFSARWALFFLMLGIAYGLLMGLTRMVQGGHFPSDVLWAGGIVYLTGLILYYALGLDRNIALNIEQ